MTSKMPRMATKEMQCAYDAGAECRSSGSPKCANPFFHATNLWACWLGGWNDCDMATLAKIRGN